jgi:hypothetical protein
MESQSAFSLKQALSVATIRDGREAEIQTGKSSDVSLPMHIQSDREWHFDSLREVLNRSLDAPAGEVPARDVGSHPQTDHSFVPER